MLTILKLLFGNLIQLLCRCYQLRSHRTVLGDGVRNISLLGLTGTVFLLVHETAMAMGSVQGDRRDAPQVYKAVEICYKMPGWHAHPTMPPDA